MPPPTESLYSKYYYQVGCAIMGFGTPCVSNYFGKRPSFSGIQRHFAFGLIGWIVGHYMDKYMTNKWMHRDAMVRHYIELHPEDFKDERKKYKEIFDEWYPVR